MVHYECDTCGASFDFISHFQEHVRSKTTCEKYMNKRYDCEHCDKKFGSEKAKKLHLRKTCSKNPLLIELENTKKLLEETSNKLEQLEKQTNPTTNPIINPSPNPTNQLSLSAPTTTTNNNSHNTQNNHSHNTNNNITNNVQNNTINQNIIIDFGNEDVELLEFSEKIAILKKCYSSILECIRLTHCNDRLPEQKNIKLSNLRSKYAKKMNEGKFETVITNELVEDTVLNRAGDVKTIYNKYKKQIPESDAIKIEDLLEKVRIRDKKQMIKEKSDAKLLLYNYYMGNKNN